MSRQHQVLTDHEIEQLYAENQGMIPFARKIEAAVRARIDNATILIYDGVAWTKKVD